MRESSFIDQNREKWEAFEEILDRKDKDPDELNDLFIQVTDDLSFSRTFYPHRMVRAYLNGLAQKVYISIYKTKRSRRSRLVEFWREELPFIVWESRWDFLLSLLLFAFSMAIGAFSSAMDPDFARVILGDGYVSMTEGNIAAGDPMAVYKDEESLGMSLYIISNNLFVAFLTFFSGVLFAVGTVGILVRNGVMVGVFQYFFVERGLFEESFLTIWMHGALEIPAIVIAGAAGLTMGRGLIFPGTLSRMKAFQYSARRGLKIMLSLVPIFIVAGIIEGFLTRHTELPDIFRALFIFGCFALVGWYYLWYPIRKARTGFRVGDPDPLLHPDDEGEVDFHRIQSGGEIFSGTFSLFRRDLGRIAGRAALAALAFCALVFPFTGKEPAVVFIYSWEFMGMMKVIPDLIRNPDVPWMPFLQIFLFTWLSTQYLQFIRRSALGAFGRRDEKLNPLVLWLPAALGAALLVIFLLPRYNAVMLVFLLVAPLALLWVYIMLWEERNALQSLGRFFELLLPQTGRFLGFALLLAAVGYLFFLLLDSVILWLVFETIGLNFSFSQSVMDNLATVMLTFFTLFLLFALLGAMVYGAALLYFTLLEINDASHLRSRIEEVSVQRRIQGLPRE